MWKTISSKTLAQTKRFKFQEDEIELPNGKRGQYQILERRDFVLVIAKHKEKFYLVNQYRYAVKSWSLEFVEGGIEKREAPLEAAKRKLQEEAGVTSNDWKEIGYQWLANSYSTQGFYIFVAENCVKHNETKLDDMEYGLTMEEKTFNEINQKIKQGEIKDAPTIAAWALYLLRYDKN